MRGIPPLEDVTVLPLWAKLWWKRYDLVRDQGPGDDIDGRVADMAERKSGRRWRGWSTGECNLSSPRCRCATCGGIGIGASGPYCEKGAGLVQIHC